MATVTVRVTPRAGRTAVAGLRDGTIHIKLAAAPVEGAANSALIAFLSDQLHVPKSAIRIASGARSRVKHVEIDGLTGDDIHQRLNLT